MHFAARAARQNVKLTHSTILRMDEIIPNLWLGSYPGIRRLRDNVNGIQSILSILRGRMIVPDVCTSHLPSSGNFVLIFRKTFVHLQIPLDDTNNANIMSFFLQAIEFIQTELNGGKRVLVHCQAGISTSRNPLFLRFLIDHFKL